MNISVKSLSSAIVLFWFICTGLFFSVESGSSHIPGIAEGALQSLIFAYVPVLLFSVFLLLYLTRKREKIDWENHYTVDKKTAAKEACLSVAYLLVTQIILGLFFNVGLHFPGPFIYQTANHSAVDVWIWAFSYFLIYVVLPLWWLNAKGFKLLAFLRSLEWLRNSWILVVYWAMDFFGPIFSGADFFGLTALQYSQAIPMGVFVNTLGAGLPVVVMMHMIFLPRMSVLFESRLLVIAFGGLFYALFSMFDQGVDYSSVDAALMSFTYIIMTQTLVGMGKSAFTVVTGNPFIHFITLHVLSARIPFDTKMYAEIFSIK